MRISLIAEKLLVFQEGLYCVVLIYISDTIRSVLVMSPVQIIMREL
jgi:hypothetical protein